MIIRCWGARGSVPVSGSEYLKYGGDTCCVEVETAGGASLVIDAGSGIRRLGNKIIEDGRREVNMFFTHSHWDHILGFPFFKPIYLDGMRLNMFGCPYTQESIKRMLSRTMSYPNFPVRLEDVKADIFFHETCAERIMIHDAAISSIALSHPNHSTGYKIVADGKTFVFFTDHELGYDHPGSRSHAEYIEFVSGADLLVHDSEYSERDYPAKMAWGHSIFTRALEFAVEAKVGAFGLFHHNQERTDSQIDAMVRECEDILVKKNSKMRCFAVRQDMEVRL